MTDHDSVLPPGSPLANARFSYLFILVHDLPTMLAFYRDVLGARVRYMEEGLCAFLAFGDAGSWIALYTGRETAVGGPGHWFIVIDVDDIDAAVSGLRDAGVSVGAIKDVPYGKAAMLNDPEGNMVEIHQMLG